MSDPVSADISFSRTPPLLSADAFRAAMGRHFASVCLITTAHEGKFHGLTATAVASVSAEPPRLLVCVNKSAATHRAVQESGSFCVNVLSSAHESLAVVFADKDTRHERFQPAQWRTLETGAPAFVNAAAAMDCIVREHLDEGTHSIFIGDVVGTMICESRGCLVYGQRKFLQIAADQP